jgi:hypothetical protein
MRTRINYMTSRLIEHRTNPTVLSDAELQPSQRALFEIPNSNKRSWPLSSHAINTLGEVLAYDVALLVDETHLESGRPLSEVRSLQEHLGMLAGRMLRYDPTIDLYEEFDNAQEGSIDTVSVTANVSDGYDSDYGYNGKLDNFNGRSRYFTPEGYVYDPPEGFRQRLTTLRMKNTDIFVEDRYFNFSVSGFLALYTNNLSAQPPRWEYRSGDGTVSDMLPGRPSDPYHFHLRPCLVPNEVLAQSVVGSLSRVINNRQ